MVEALDIEHQKRLDLSKKDSASASAGYMSLRPKYIDIPYAGSLQAALITRIGAGPQSVWYEMLNQVQDDTPGVLNVSVLIGPCVLPALFQR